MSALTMISITAVREILMSEVSHLITRISAVTYMINEANRSQSSTPKPGVVMRFEMNLSATAATASTVKTSPVATMAAPFLFRPCIVSIAGQQA